MARVVEQIGDYRAVIEVQPPGVARLHWEREDGQELSRAPSGISKIHADAYQAFKDKLKSIRNTLSVQTRRIESFYLEDLAMSFGSWRKHYAQHPLMKSIAGNLVWLFRNEVGVASGILQGDELVSFDDSRLSEFSEDTQVYLWHPLHSEESERDAWRNYMWRHSVAQPFRQVYREIYRGEQGEDFTEIVSGLYVRQHQFRALLLSRGWSYGLRGSFECDSAPVLGRPDGFCCEIGIGGVSQSVSGRGIALAVELGAIEFSKDGRVIAAAEVPPLLYSELLRDIDLFTSVSGVGYRRDWEDIEAVFKELVEFRIQEQFASAGDSTSTILGNLLENSPLSKALIDFLARLEAAVSDKPIPETVKVRAQLLEVLLRAASLADRIRIEGRYAFVDGPAGRYKINLASGLIFDCTNNGLCGVANRRGRADMPGETGSDILLAKIYETVRYLATSNQPPRNYDSS